MRVALATLSAAVLLVFLGLVGVTYGRAVELWRLRRFRRRLSVAMLEEVASQEGITIETETRPIRR